MPKLLLLRHLKSQWNKENRFSGWTDIPLSDEGKKSAKEIAKKLRSFKIDKVCTSPLRRNQDTVDLVLKNLHKETLPVIVDKALNERHYGKLQGMNKEEAKKKYGKDQVRLWRRGWDEALPGGESLKDVAKRLNPFYEKYIKPELKKQKNVLVVASHNSLRALIKRIEKISDSDIINVEMGFGELRVYELDQKLNLKNKKII
ncbi:MAG: 2,3-diphosphoglycerate-dependent phosphoglycerate mutase [Candidatus Nealsonbacteria bacterium]